MRSRCRSKRVSWSQEQGVSTRRDGFIGLQQQLGDHQTDQTDEPTAVDALMTSVRAEQNGAEPTLRQIDQRFSRAAQSQV